MSKEVQTTNVVNHRQKRVGTQVAEEGREVGVISQPKPAQEPHRREGSQAGAGEVAPAPATAIATLAACRTAQAESVNAPAGRGARDRYAWDEACAALNGGVQRGWQ